MHDIPVLMLHTVNDEPAKSPMGVLSVSSKGFENYLRMFRRAGYQMISMDDLLCRRYDAHKKFVVLTFDDGFKDNLTVAMPIMKKYGARGTIFVNPGYISEESDPASQWGFMTWDEVQKAHESGVFDIQAHTMTHEFVFSSDKVVDYYSPEKFNKYYWLTWMLFPETPRKWDSSAMEYKNKIPAGYPIFEFGRRVSNRKFTPSQEYVEALIKAHNENTEIHFSGDTGTYETDDEYNAYVTWEIEECKRVLEEKLGKKIHTLCFPGGGYTDFALRCAEGCGYACYMTASKLRIGNNNDHLKKIYSGSFCGLNRTAFSLIHPGVLPDSFFDYWVARISLGAYQNEPVYRFIKKILSKVCHG